MSRSRPRSAPAAGLLALLAAGVLTGCGDKAKTPAAEPPPVAAPARDGLEALWWTAEDRDGLVARRVAGLIASGRAQWDPAGEALRPFGLRVVRTRADAAGDLRETLPIAGIVERRWMGQVPSWSVLVSGQPRNGFVLSLPEGELELPAGRLRALVRAWTGPEAGAGARPRAVLNVELALQHADARGVRDADPLDGPRGPARIEDEGLLFARAVLRGTLGPDEALLVVADAPGADWSGTIEPSDRAGRDAPASGVGPAAPEAPTPGEAALTDRERGVPASRRVVIALVARVPETFSLIGPVR